VRARGVRRALATTTLAAAQVACAARPAGWTTIGTEESVFPTARYRGARALEILAHAPCDASAPIALEIDGRRLSANPSGALVRWHVLVRGERARARRLDGGPGELLAIDEADAACGARFARIAAPTPVRDGLEERWGDGVRAPGLELWLRAGVARGAIDVEAKEPGESQPDRAPVHLEVGAQRGFEAIDPEGARWVRVARVGLPPWATAGVRVRGGDGVAVRPIVRAPRTTREDADRDAAARADAGEQAEPSPLDEALLARLSREVLAAVGEARGAAYLARAAVLAEGGAGRAALEDARAARALGAKGPAGEDAVAWVRARVRRRARPWELPAGVDAYGVEPDFDDGAPRCAPSTEGTRGRLAAIAQALEAGRAAAAPRWDPALAARAIEIAWRAPDDPRARRVLAWSLAGSRWQALRVEPRAGVPLRVDRVSEIAHEGAIDAEGDLRARVGAGLPFPRSTYAIVTDSRPARAALPSLDGARAAVEWVCFPRAPADARGPCPFAITVGDDAPSTPATGDDGRGRALLPALPARGRKHDVTLALSPAPGRWVAVARVVYDREVPGTTRVPGEAAGASAAAAEAWVLPAPGLQRRWLLKRGESMTIDVAAGAILRVDAKAEPEERPHVRAVLDGETRALASDGTPELLVARAAGPLRVTADDGAATVVLAERIATPRDEVALDAPEADPVLAEPLAETPVTASPARLDANDSIAAWRDEVSRSARPLGSLEEQLGTLTARSEGRFGNYRDGNLIVDRDATDGYFEQAIGYRRRVESIGLWLGAGAFERARTSGGATFGASGLAYEELGRLRIAGWLDYFQQDLGFDVARSYRPRAFVEYSIRVRPDVFVLPRLGYDGFHGNLERRPATLKGVDDDVFNSYRFARPTLAFAQVLGWWVPYLNDIFYLRARATWDTRAGALDHVALRPGTFLAIGPAEIGAYGDATFYRETSAPGSQAAAELTGAAYVLFDLWLAPQSVDLQPGVGARARTRDGAWEVFALVNVVGSFRRGLRDFTSFELNFPEPLGGGVPWRGGLR
jgi:hypothetical protein